MFLLIVVVVYATSLRAGHWPSGNPWSGFVLGMQGVITIAIANTDLQPPFSIMQLGAAALGLIAALIWMVGSFLTS